MTLCLTLTMFLFLLQLSLHSLGNLYQFYWVYLGTAAYARFKVFQAYVNAIHRKIVRNCGQSRFSAVIGKLCGKVIREAAIDTIIICGYGYFIHLKIVN